MSRSKQDNGASGMKPDRATAAAQSNPQAVSSKAGIPSAFTEQACFISMRGMTVTIECDDAEAANEVFEWLSEAEGIEEAALESALDRMGWPEIHAFQNELRHGQSVYEDAGGFFMRAIKALFGVGPRDPVLSYQEAGRALIAQAIKARRAETGTGSVEDESAVPEGNAP